MDSYEILGVNKDSSDKDIEVAYNDLKRKYDPAFNTSIKAYKKYREILKAYENVKNDIRRRMYDLKDDQKIENSRAKKYKLYDFSKKEDSIKEEILDVNSLEEISEVKREDIVINKKISYLYYLLNLKIDLVYFKDVICNECSNFVVCDECEGVGVVYYKEKQCYCPKCHGAKKISEGCLSCHDEGNYKKEEKISLFVDNEKMIINDLGNEYYDSTKSNVIINFDFFDKEKISVLNSEIRVNYYLNKEETFNGVNKDFYGENGAFKLEVPSFVNDGYTKEINFNNKKIIFTFYNSKIEGNNTIYHLFINNKYKNQSIYFNEDYTKCDYQKNDVFFNEIKLEEKIIINNKGEKGIYGGNDGDLIIKCFFDNSKDIKYIRDVEEINTSKIFNMLGGKFNGISHYGFKGNNCLIKSNDKYYLLNGQSCEKIKLKDLFLFKIISLLLLFIVPGFAFIISYSEAMYVVLISILISYLLLINLLMEVKV